MAVDADRVDMFCGERVAVGIQYLTRRYAELVASPVAIFGWVGTVISGLMRKAISTVVPASPAARSARLIE